MTYLLKTSLIRNNSREPLLIGPLIGAELMIKLTNTAVSGVLERFGSDVFSFRWERDGKIGRRQSLYFGETEHFLDVPQSGEYWLKVFPSRYIFNFSIEVYEMVLDTDLSALALKTGIRESFLRLQSSQIIQLLEGLDKMLCERK